MVLVVKKRLILIIALVLAFFAAAAGTTAVIAAYSPKPQFTVVLDAGHGGADAGAIGVKTDVKESEINLLITQTVKTMLEEQKIKVVLTRKDADGLYGTGDGKMKTRDMNERKRIINETEPDAVISIHCNKFPDSSRRGAQAFFDDSSEAGIFLAKTIQANFNTLNEEQIGKRYAALKGEYFMLKCSPYPSVIAECGFLSNAADDELLNDGAYRERLCRALSNGIIAYLSNYSL